MSGATKTGRYGPSRSTRPFAYRIENIPAATTREQLLVHFTREDRAFIRVESLAPAADNKDENGDLVSTISFTAADAATRAPLPKKGNGITVDKDFYGLTPLNQPQGPISADIIAITGLAGHAFGSWATKDGFMWLRDGLPKDFPHARVLAYGYPSQLESNEERNIITDFAGSFIQRIQIMRKTAECGDRPMVLIGHSLGCLIIKQALVDARRALGPTSEPFPVSCVIFLGAPHRGLHIDALETLVESKPTEDIVRELKAGSPTLTYLNENFRNVVSDVQIVSVYEKRPTPTAIQLPDGSWKRHGPLVKMVSDDSARLYLPQEKAIPAHANHSEIAKITRGENSIYHLLKGHIMSAIARPSQKSREIHMKDEHDDTQDIRRPKTKGMFQLWPKENSRTDEVVSNTRLDIVAIHGLGGDAYKTWMDGSRLWLSDFLPSHVPEARVLSFGYSASDALAWFGTGIEQQAITLLSKLNAARNNKSRKFVFVCHDFGGLIFKEALLLADKPDSPHRWLVDHTLGVVFFGTPQHGPDNKWWKSVILKLLRGPEQRSVLLDIVDDISGIVEKMGELCSSVSPTLFPGLIYSFYATRDTPELHDTVRLASIFASPVAR